MLALLIACGNGEIEPAQIPATYPTAKPATPTKGESYFRYSPSGPDRDCRHFSSQREAQEFFIAAGGPERDPHRLDADKDRMACEALWSAYLFRDFDYLPHNLSFPS